MTIGERIAQIRKEHGLSQETFGESLGVTRQSISKWEANNSMPEVEKLLTMSKLYEVPIGWILGEEIEQGVAEKKVLKSWQKAAIVISICFVVALLGVLYYEILMLDNRYDTLISDLKVMQENLLDNQSDINEEINDITTQLEGIIDKQNSMLEDQKIEE